VLCTPTVVVPEIFTGSAAAVVAHVSEPASEPANIAVITNAFEKNLIVFPSEIESGALTLGQQG
jgi:hypothetical protein